MFLTRALQAAVVVSCCALASQAAAPAPSSFVNVETTISRIQSEWEAQQGQQKLDDSGWNSFFSELLADLKAYSSSQNESEKLSALGRIFDRHQQLQYVAWGPAAEVRSALDGWLRPRVSLAWAVRRLEDTISNLPPASTPEQEENRQAWVKFAKEDLAEGLKQYESANTVIQKVEALEGLHDKLDQLRRDPRTLSWWPSVNLYQALSQTFEQPNVEATVDFATAASFLSQQIVIAETIYRKGQYSYITPGPYLGFGLLYSDDGIGFFNKQVANSYTPIRGFEQQLVAADPRGKRLAKMYEISASTSTRTDNTAYSYLRPTGIDLITNNVPQVGFGVGLQPQQGGGLTRMFASLLGYNKERIQREIYQNAYPQVQAEAIQGAKELSDERRNAAEVRLDAQLANYLIGNRTAVYGPVAVTGLDLRSRPQYVWARGNVEWSRNMNQAGAEVDQPPGLSTYGSGITADIHLPSVLNNMVQGYLESDAVRNVENLMVETRDVAPGQPTSDAVKVTPNTDFATFLDAINSAQATGNPKAAAFRVKRPAQLPAFAPDRDGNLVAVLRDLSLEVPAPTQASGGGGLAGPPAKFYRIVAPRAEMTIDTQVVPASGFDPLRLKGKILAFEPGPGARVFAVNDSEENAVALNAITNTIVLGALRARIQAQEIDVPLRQLQIPGVALQSVSRLDPSGWLRANLLRTQ